MSITMSIEADKAMQTHARGELYGLLAAGLSYPREGGPLDDWDQPGYQRRLRAAAKEAGLALEQTSAFDRLFQGLPCVFLKRADVEAEYTRLFGPGRKPPVPPYETLYTASYAPTARHSQELADIQGFYHAFGLAVAENSADRPDHIALELEFLGVLCKKEAHAIVEEMDEAAGIALDARRAFLADHVGCWAIGFADRLEEHATLPLYQQLAVILRELIRAEMESLEITPAKMAHDPAPAQSDDQDDRLTCGGCPMNGANEEEAPIR